MNRKGQLGEILIITLFVLAAIGLIFLFCLPTLSANRQECVYKCGLEGLELKEVIKVNGSLKCLCQEDGNVVIIE